MKARIIIDWDHDTATLTANDNPICDSVTVRTMLEKLSSTGNRKVASVIETFRSPEVTINLEVDDLLSAFLRGAKPAQEQKIVAVLHRKSRSDKAVSSTPKAAKTAK